MWTARLRIKHNCIIGSRCRKFGVTDTGIAFNVYSENGVTHAPQIQVLHGRSGAIKNFIEDLKKDSRVRHLESEDNVVFLIEERSDRIPSSFYNPKLIMVKPVEVDKEGYEYWEIASWNRKIIEDFIKSLERDRNINEMKVLKLKKSKLIDVYFMHAAPKLTEPQKRAMELALEQGYYTWPKKTGLKGLAKLMGVSIQTYREHLKKAEEKLMPEVVKSLRK